MVLEKYVGQTLDGKYRLERLLGQGGMGAVYLATHLGTERFVALKLITPQFMRNEEFVERFKREAKAAGRLRHPNVVDVTDFGFAESSGETVAYLVMEYLDGCTLADVLREEHRLPVEWVVDILEQVCSAVHEAHQQGIVHRDLKPENIWLEPNRLGGYRVKVLDFGIAKLGHANVDGKQKLAAPTELVEEKSSTAGTSARPTEFSNSATASTAILDKATSKTNSASRDGELEATTMLYGGSAVNQLRGKSNDAQVQSDSEAVDTQILAPTLPYDPVAQFGAGDRTQLMNQETRPFLGRSHTTVPNQAGAQLTRVGAIMGTPAYMSPEQCAGKPSDARSDIYSLGVIAYQMLAGEPPFTGETAKVMQDHLEANATPLRERTKVPERVANLIMSALAKNADDRPQTAQAFANSLRAQAEGIGSLYRRAFALYSEYFPKFLKLSLIAHIPVIMTTVLLVVVQLAEKAQPRGQMTVTRISLIVLLAIVGLMQVIAYFLAASAISGVTAVIVTQVSAAPLRPVELRTAIAVLRRRWRPFLKTAIRVTLRILLGYVLLVIPGFVITVRYALYAPVVLMEGLQGKAAMKRARELASRSWRTVIIVSLLQIVIPLCVTALLGSISVEANRESAGAWRTSIQPLKGLVNIIIVPLMSIVPALLYLKMRQVGGEPLVAALAQIEEVETRRSQWQQRMRSRLSLPTVRSRG